MHSDAIPRLHLPVGCLCWLVEQWWWWLPPWGWGVQSVMLTTAASVSSVTCRSMVPCLHFCLRYQFPLCATRLIDSLQPKICKPMKQEVVSLWHVSHWYVELSRFKQYQGKVWRDFVIDELLLHLKLRLHCCNCTDVVFWDWIVFTEESL